MTRLSDAEINSLWQMCELEDAKEDERFVQNVKAWELRAALQELAMLRQEKRTLVEAFRDWLHLDPRS